MATLMKQQKIIQVVNSLLTSRGWRNVTCDVSGVFENNNNYLYIRDFLEELNSRVGIKNFVCSASINVNAFSADNDWVLMRDGFLISCGKFRRGFANLYTQNFVSKEGDFAIEWADEITKLAKCDYVDALLLKKREKIVKGSDEELIAVRGQHLGKIISLEATLCFALRQDIKREVFGMYTNLVYRILSTRKSESEAYVSVAPYSMDLTRCSEELAIEVPYSKFMELQRAGFIEPVLITKTNTTREYYYEPIYNSSNKGFNIKQFECFNLSNSQMAVLAPVVSEGFNFTPLLDNNLSVNALKIIADLIRSGTDCRCLCGKNLSMEHLDFLRVLTKNNVPLRLYTDQDISLEMIRRNYEGKASVIEQKLEGFSHESKVVLKKIMHSGKSFNHLLDNSVSSLRIGLMAEQQGRFKYLADLLLKRGIETTHQFKISWISLSEDEKSRVLKHFRSFGALCYGKDFDEYLCDSRNQFTALYYMNGVFYLSTQTFFVHSDYNSICLSTIYPELFWRAVYVNGKHYYFERIGGESYL